MTVARLAVQPASSKAMRASSSSSSTNTTTNTNDSIDPKTTLRLSSSNDKGKGSSTSLSSTQQPPQQSSTPNHHQQEEAPAPLFTPIWDYDRYPVGPCVRENNRSSQEHDNPFQMLEYHHRPQSNVRPNPLSATMMRSGSSSSSASSASSATSFQQQKKTHGGSGSRSSSSSRHGSLRINLVGKSMSNSSNGNGISEFPPGTTFSAPPSPSLAMADPSSSSSISPDLLLAFQQSLYGGDVDDHHHLADLDQEPISAMVAEAMTVPAAPTSKFDLYKAQMNRVRSSHRLHGRSASAYVSASASAPFPTTMVEGGHLPFPSTPSSSVYSPPSISSPTIIYTHSSPSSASSSVASSNNNNNNSKKAHHHHHIFPKLFKKPSLSKSSRVRNLPTAQPPTSTATPAIIDHSQDGSRASLALSRRGSRSIEPLHNQQLQKSPIEEQQDHWREEWLRPSGAIHSMFRDGPSKFNCPHCGAMKVVSNVQFVPGLMSYLVAFGLMFLTLGTLSYLPFRKDHEGTKDCIHWCPECEQKVARFNRANSTWEWI
ncbi:hypothetical protein BGZ96_009404 [Linnemannia gamsii]|uniref:LITAF domain-containing protein n=1 Tax=Linnemannia gamsii TaxID=64522 RepID=A0ABQ7JWU4_9FUNG|nr:hypothetical protein BGZ96_009404 [Linnemannia gamsii]